MNEKLKKVLNTPLYDLNLNVRHINSLWKAHIKTIGQLIDFNHDIGCIRGINRKLVPNILEEIVKYINSEGLYAYIDSNDYDGCQIIIEEYEFVCSYLRKIFYSELYRLGIEYSDYVFELPKWPPFNLIDLLGCFDYWSSTPIKNIDKLNEIVTELGLPKIYDEENGNNTISWDMSSFLVSDTWSQISKLNISDEKMKQIINKLDNPIEENDAKVKVKKIN